MADLEDRIKDLVEELGDGWIVLIKSETDRIGEDNTQAIKAMTDKGMEGIVLSANKPCGSFKHQMENEGIDTSKLFIVCPLCEDDDSEGVIHCGHVTSLTEMSVGVNEAIKRVKGETFLMINSISTLLIHNGGNDVARFVHSLLTKMRKQNVRGVMLSAKEDDQKVISEIAQLSDKIIEV